MRFYVDTSIWMDLCENRKGFRDEPLDRYAFLFFLHVLDNHTLIVSDVLVQELGKYYSDPEIGAMLRPFNIIRVRTSSKQGNAAEKLMRERGVPLGDALHAVLARDMNAVLVTRDKHFALLIDVVESKKPEEIISASS